MTFSPDPTPPKPQEKYQLGNYVVCIIDILAQKEKLKSWSVLPTDGQITPAFSSALKDTIGAVLFFHEAFSKYFEARLTQSRLTGINLSLMDSVDRELYRRQKESKLEVAQFSDTFVFYAPLGNSHGELSVLPVYAILGACSMAMLLSLAAKIPLRGGIHIGPGLKLPQLSFYGPALAEAHRLESCVAQYPRIVVSPSVVRFVQHTPSSTSSALIDDWTKEMLKICREMLVIDVFDGQPIVDWLGDGFRKTLNLVNETKIFEALDKAHDFVGQTAHAFQRQFEISKHSNDEKLFKRYMALYQYLYARLPEWGITILDLDLNESQTPPNA